MSDSESFGVMTSGASTAALLTLQPELERVAAIGFASSVPYSPQTGAGPINGPVRYAFGQSVTRPVERMMSLASPVLRNSMNDCAAGRSAVAFAIAASNTVPSFIDSGTVPR